MLLSDGLVFGEQNFDMECAAPKDPEKFRKSVFEARILSPDAFTHASVAFAYLDLGPIDSTRGCKMDIASARAVQEAWTHLLTASGAKVVTFVPRAPSQATLAEAHVPLGHGDPT